MFQAFDKVIGHDMHKKFFSLAISRGLLSHAYMFSGPASVGKRTFAIAVASSELGISDEALFRHPDVYECVVEEDSIGVDDVRDVIRFASRRPVKAKALHILISRAERLTPAAADALLKTIEDPAAPIHIYLTVESKDQVPETIVSRVQNIHFTPVSETVLIAAFPKASPKMIELSFGCPGRVVSWLQNPSLFEKEEKIHDFFKEVPRLDFVSRRALFSTLFEGDSMTGDELIRIVDAWDRHVSSAVFFGEFLPEKAHALHTASILLRTGLSQHVHPELLVDRVLSVV